MFPVPPAIALEPTHPCHCHCHCRGAPGALWRPAAASTLLPCTCFCGAGAAAGLCTPAAVCDAPARPCTHPFLNACAHTWYSLRSHPHHPPTRYLIPHIFAPEDARFIHRTETRRCGPQSEGAPANSLPALVPMRTHAPHAVRSRFSFERLWSAALTRNRPLHPPIILLAPFFQRRPRPSVALLSRPCYPVSMM